MPDPVTNRATAQLFRAAVRLALSTPTSTATPSGNFWLVRDQVPVAVRYSRCYHEAGRASWWYGITKADAERLAVHGELVLIMPHQDQHRFLLLDAVRTRSLLGKCTGDLRGDKKIHITLDVPGGTARLQEWPELELGDRIRRFSSEVLAGAGVESSMGGSDEDDASTNPVAAVEGRQVRGPRTLGTPRRFDPSRLPTPLTKVAPGADPFETLVFREKANVEHHKLVTALDAYLTASGWREIAEIPSAVDLWASRQRDGRRVIFECKTLNLDHPASELNRCRLGLAQLLEYRFEHGEPEDELCLVTNASVSDVRVEFLESLGVGVMWFRHGELFLLGTRAAELL